jgi:TM2 domain-containing membrane protein YozV
MKSLNLKSSLIALSASAMAVSLLISSWVQDGIIARIHGAKLYRTFLEKYLDIDGPLPVFEGALADVEKTVTLISTITFVIFVLAFFIAGFVTYKIAHTYGKGRKNQNSLIWLGAAVYSLAMLPIDILSYVVNPFSSSYSLLLYVPSVVSVAVFQIVMLALIAFGFISSHRKKKTDAFEEKLESKSKPTTNKIRLRLLTISVAAPLLINTTLMVVAYPTQPHRDVANKITAVNESFFDNISDSNVEKYDKKLKQLTTTPEGKYSDRVNIFGSIVTFPVSIAVIVWVYWQLRKKGDPKPMQTFLAIGAITSLIGLWFSEGIHRLYGLDSLMPLWLLGIFTLIVPLFSLLPTWIIGLITKYFYEKRNGFEA